MRWLIHGLIEPQAADLLRQRGDTIVDPSTLDPVPADIAAILLAARRAQLDILTCDPALPAAVYESAMAFKRSIVFLQAAASEHELSLMRLFERYKRLTPSRLYTVTASRVKIRQLPGA